MAATHARRAGSKPRRKVLPLAGLVLLLAGGLFAAGCSRSSDAESQAQPSAKAKGQQQEKKSSGSREQTRPASAQAVLEAMAEAYRTAPSYTDQGQVELRVKAPTAEGTAPSGQTGPQEFEDNAPMAVSFERPNKLRVQAYQGVLTSDGEQIRGMVSELADQVLAREAPETITLESIYSDPVLAQVFTQGIAGSPVQLVLLLGDEPLEAILAGAQAPMLGEPQKVDGRMCHRVEAERPDGKLALWIDQQSHELRRIELPTEELKRHIASGGQVESVRVWVDFKGAKLGGKPPAAAYRLEAPSEARLVQAFDVRGLTPAPPPPSPLLGQPAPEFEVADLEGNPLSLASLEGKIVVLDFWFTTCPPCRQSLPNLEKVYQQYKDDERVRFVAMSVDPAEVGDDALKAAFQDLGVNVPIARDPEQQVSKKLGIEGYPTLVLVGADGTVEDFEPGYNPELPTILPAKLEKLLAGESIHAEVLKEYETRRAEYERAMQQPATQEVEIPQAEIAERSEPQKLKLHKLWSIEALREPGNLLALSGDAPRLLAHDGWTTIVEFDGQGQEQARHELDLPEGDVVTTLRTAVDAAGKRYYLGLASSQKQLHLFNDEWQRVASYPADRDHEGVADALLADLEGDGELELYVSYWGVVGVQRASLAGERQWGNRSMEHVFRLAVSGKDREGERRLLCAHGRGTIVPINAEGEDATPIAPGDRFIRYVVSADVNGDDQPELLGIAPTPQGEEQAAGFSLAGDLLWSYPLPRGVHPFPPIEMITHGQLLGGPESQWVIAGADGSIHILSAEGELVDRFNYGAALHGLAVMEVDGKPVLVVSSPERVEAFHVEAPAE